MGLMELVAWGEQTWRNRDDGDGGMVDGDGGRGGMETMEVVA